MGALFRLNTDFVTPAAGTKIVKAEEYGLLLEADSLLAAPRFPRQEESCIDFSPSLRREQRMALWFTMKKLLLREVAPQWAPCFD